MNRLDADRGAWRLLRGISAVIFMTGCSGPTHDIQTPSDPTPAAAGVETLQGAWTLVSLQEAGAAPNAVPAGSFVADFGVDEDLYIEADCNVCSAAYRAGDDGMVQVIGPIPCTLAYCSTAPLDTRFLRILEGAGSWSIEEGALQLSSPDGGTLLLQRRN